MGDYALSLFLDDIDTLITHYTEVANSSATDSADSQSHHPETTVFQAQVAANKLLKAYENNARKTNAFTNQHIDVKSIVDGNGALLLVPIFSTGLKQHLLRLLDRSNKTSLH